MMSKRLLIFLLPFLCVSSAEAANERGTTELKLRGQRVLVEYGRPELKSREVLARARPGLVWRLGMNRATSLLTEADLSFGSATVPKGEYTLFAKKLGDRDWVLLVNSDTGLWGTSGYKERNDIATIPLRFATAAPVAELLTITFEPTSDSGADLSIRWGEMELRASFTLADE